MRAAVCGCARNLHSAFPCHFAFFLILILLILASLLPVRLMEKLNDIEEQSLAQMEMDHDVRAMHLCRNL